MTLQSKLFWPAARGLVLATWIILILAASVVPWEFKWLARVALVVMSLIHLAELPLALTIGKENDLTTLEIVFKTVIFGFTWWVPIRKGRINE